MSVPVVLPQLGESVVEGTITEWLVKEGDAIKKGQPLVSVATDKADTVVPSPVSGVIKKLLAAAGDKVAVRAPIAEIDASEDASKSIAPPPAAAPQPSADAAPASKDPSPSSPGSRQLARSLGVDLETVTGSGPRNRITREDVHRAAEGNGPQHPEALTPPAAPRPPVTTTEARHAPLPSPSGGGAAPAANPGAFRVPPYVEAGGDEVVPFDRRRRIIADHMVFSKHVSPHVMTIAEVDLYKTHRLREEKKAALKAEGVNLTFLSFIAAATVHALREHPLLNAHVLDGAFVKLKAINLGIAVETEKGLIVPVVKHADDLTVRGIARAIETAAKRARDGQTTPDELQGATFTISNPGLKGNLVGAAIISQPNVGILRIGEIVKRPVVVEIDGQDVIAIHPVMYMCLSYDHRIVDGVAANGFLYRVTELLEAGLFEV